MNTVCIVKNVPTMSDSAMTRDARTPIGFMPNHAGPGLPRQRVHG